MEYVILIGLGLFFIVLPSRHNSWGPDRSRNERPIDLDGAYELVYTSQDGKTFEVAEKALLDNLTLVIDKNEFHITIDKQALLQGNYELSYSTVCFNVTDATDRDMIGTHTASMLFGDDVLKLTVAGETLVWQRA